MARFTGDKCPCNEVIILSRIMYAKRHAIELRMQEKRQFFYWIQIVIIWKHENEDVFYNRWKESIGNNHTIRTSSVDQSGHKDSMMIKIIKNVVN